MRRPFPRRRARPAHSAFPLLVPLTETDPGVSELLAVKDELSRWTKPALIAFSDLDPVFRFRSPVSSSRSSSPPPASRCAIEGAAHFLQEDRGPQIVAAMLAAFGEPSALGPWRAGRLRRAQHLLRGGVAERFQFGLRVGGMNAFV